MQSLNQESRRSLTLLGDETCDASVSKILLVHDFENANDDSNNAVVDFYRSQGYSVTTLFLNDSMYTSINEFITDFQPLVKEAKDKYVCAVVHYTRTGKKDMCMYCDAITQKNTLLLKQALAVLYVSWGSERCSLICPSRCCGNTASQLPESQVKSMAVYYDDQPQHQKQEALTLVSKGTESTAQPAERPSWMGEWQEKVYPVNVWAELNSKLATLRQIASYKPITRHTRSARFVEVVPKVVEPPLTSEAIIRLLCAFFDTYFDAGQLAQALGVSLMEWEEHLKRSGNQALFLVMRRTIILNPTDAFSKIASALEQVQLTAGSDFPRLLRDFESDSSTKSILLSNYPSITELISSRNQASVLASAVNAANQTGDGGQQPPPPEFVGGKSGPWRQGIEKPDAKEGTHLDKMEMTFIPPYMRDAILNQKQPTVAEQEEIVRLAQERDKEYERNQLAREIQSGKSMGGFYTTGHLPGKSAGGAKPM